jgi:hypothetical protein
MEVHPLLSKMKAETLRLLYLWIHAGDGASMTVAELELLTDRSPYHVKVALKELAKDGLSIFSGLADHAVCQLTINAYNLFMTDQPTGQFEISQTLPQPTAGLATQSGSLQPTGGQADQPTGHLSLSSHAPQNSLQKKFFSGEKNFFPSEEEDLIKLNLNNIKSSSSSESASDEKNFFQGVPPHDLEERLKALATYGRFFSDRVRNELARLEHCTPDYIRAMACEFYHVEKRTRDEGGMLRRRLLDHGQPPARLCLDCWREDHPPEPEDEESHSTPKSPVAEAEILGWDGVGMEPEAAWQAAMGQLQSEMPKATFDSWVRDARFAGYDHGTFRMQFYNAYARDWCQARLSSQFTRILSGFFNREVALEFISLGDDHVV